METNYIYLLFCSSQNTRNKLFQLNARHSLGKHVLEPLAVAVSPYGWLMTHYGWLAG